MANLVVGYALLFGVGELAIGLSLDALAVALGMLAMAIGLALYFGKVRRAGPIRRL